MDKNGEAGLKLLLINSGDNDPFVAFYDGGNLKEYHASDYLGSEGPSAKKPDKLINCLNTLTNENDINEIDAIAVTVGPGSFTGIRVGLSLAKGLAFGLTKKIIPITNFELTLNRIKNFSPDKRYGTIIPAKLPEYYYSLSNPNDNIEQGCTNLDELLKNIQKDTIIVGDFDDETKIKHHYFEYINVKNLKKEAVSLGELALKGFQQGKAIEAEDAEPLYLKDFSLKKHNN